MAVNRGKQFEGAIKEGIEKCADVSIDRFQDPMAGFAGIRNVCDFVVYRFPFQYYFECKSFYGNTLSIHSNDPKHRYGAITNDQWEGLEEKSHIPGVFAGVCAWFIDHDVTVFVPIQSLIQLKNAGRKSLNIKDIEANSILFVPIYGKKKRVLFDYDMSTLFLGLEIETRNHWDKEKPQWLRTKMTQL